MFHIVKEWATLTKKGNNSFLRFIGSQFFSIAFQKSFKTPILLYKTWKFTSRARLSPCYPGNARTAESAGFWKLARGPLSRRRGRCRKEKGGAGVKTTQTPPRAALRHSPRLSGCAEAGKHGRHLFSQPGFDCPGRVVALTLRQLGR